MQGPSIIEHVVSETEKEPKVGTMGISIIGPHRDEGKQRSYDTIRYHFE